jgi:hypothetical protein
MCFDIINDTSVDYNPNVTDIGQSKINCGTLCSHIVDFTPLAGSFDLPLAAASHRGCIQSGIRPMLREGTDVP